MCIHAAPAQSDSYVKCAMSLWRKVTYDSAPFHYGERHSGDLLGHSSGIYDLNNQKHRTKGMGRVAIPD